MLNAKPWIEPIVHLIIWLTGLLLVAGYVNNIGYINREMAVFIPTILVGTAFNISLFYLVSFWLIPRYSSRKLWLILSFYLLLLLCGLTVVESLLDFFFLPNYYSTEKEPYYAQFATNLTVNIFILSIAMGYGFTREWTKGEKQRQELRSEKLSAELNYLKAQVNPHFLFNMLNLAFASATKSGDDFTADLIEKIASQMRYMIYDSNIEKVPVGKEIEHIEGFISLQKLRISKEMPVSIRYQSQGNCNGNTIAPLLLIPFVENAFKHGLSYDKASEISIEIACRDNALELHVTNPLKPRSSTMDRKDSGIGLENVRKRLELLYPALHKLEINKKNGRFNVHLQIQLN